jgi:hypothetical protein
MIVIRSADWKITRNIWMSTPKKIALCTGRKSVATRVSRKTANERLLVFQ